MRTKTVKSLPAHPNPDFFDKDEDDLYPEFLGESSPVDWYNPSEHDALNFLG